MKASDVFNYVIELFSKAGSSIYSALFAVFMFVINYLAPEKMAFIVVLVAVIIDAVFGVLVAIKLKKFILSSLGRRVFLKISAYFSALLLLYMVEEMVHDSGFIGVKLASAWAVACEFWSFSAHVLILSPNAIFFRVARVQLRGEMEKKTGRDLSDILDD